MTSRQDRHEDDDHDYDYRTSYLGIFLWIVLILLTLLSLVTLLNYVPLSLKPLFCYFQMYLFPAPLILLSSPHILFQNKLILSCFESCSPALLSPHFPLNTAFHSVILCLSSCLTCLPEEYSTKHWLLICFDSPFIPAMIGRSYIHSLTQLSSISLQFWFNFDLSWCKARRRGELVTFFE